MSESRVDRLLRRAEESAEAGDNDKSDQFLAVLQPAIYLRNREIKELEKMTANVTTDHD
jgi:hypothetical protein